jgi:hypothetical protein
MIFRNRIFTLVLAITACLLALATALILWGSGITSIHWGGEPTLSLEQRIDPKQDQPLDLEKAADQAEALSQEVYHGLDTTQEIIGKTEARNEAIEQGRTTASGKLKDLADRARQAETAEDPVLSKTDQRVLKNISE